MAANGVQRTVPDISFLLAHASHVLATRMAEALQEIGLTPRMFGVLMRALNGELTQLELAQVAGLDKTTIVVIVDELEDAGYAERVPPPAPGGPGLSGSPRGAGKQPRPRWRSWTGCTRRCSTRCRPASATRSWPA